MPTFADFGQSKYLQRADLGKAEALLLTIDHYTRENLAQDGKPAQYKFIAHFKELNVKPMVLNKTNGNRIAMIAKLQETDDIELSIGTKVVVYFDDMIEMMGEIVGGLRIRAPKNQAPAARPAAKPAPTQVHQYDPQEALPPSDEDWVDPNGVPFDPPF